ncbi:phospholipid metabolism-related protein [Filobasidium floriforme]|uniref:phospholipid metabolism-related protein n=1 Tax=Filobasidium floriforme TaxID=5210 RepID=UPI001E8D278B|nr:phospholipid metabolism-related protein [Filobasidium floriforme]KAH8083073.1 phospholipid metabolism-related protein [Filobasidium floriforme]
MSGLVSSVRNTLLPGHRHPVPDTPTSPVHHAWTLSRTLRSYLPDWFLVVSLWILLSFLERIGGHKRHFSLHDISIQHPLVQPETVGYKLLLFIAFGIPVLFVLLISLGIYRSKWDAHNAVLGVTTSFTITGVVTQVIKMGVGRPRPHTIAVCQPPPGTTDPPMYGLSDYTICTQTNKHLLDDAFKSFPSGHSSLSFAGMGFLAWYISGKLHVGDRRGYRTRAWLAMSPLLASAMVAVSRTADNRHHWQDVTVGSLLGLGISYVAYRAYYPALSHPSSHLPLAPRDLLPSEMGDGDEEDQQDRIGREFRDEDGDGMDDRVVPRPSEEQVWRD